jgi:hypothetical protein
MGAAYGKAGTLLEVDCGSPFSPDPTRDWYPPRAEASSSALAPGLPLAVICLIIGVVFLVRLLYMLAGTKALSSQ